MSGNNEPILIYQVAPASWMRVPEQSNRPLTSDEIGPKLAAYARRMNFTHIEILSLPELSPPGGPREVSRLIDYLHQSHLRVLLDGFSHGEVKMLHADGYRMGNLVSLFEGDSVREMKWDTYWKHDTLEYLSQDPIYRKFHHSLLTSRQRQAASEQFILPLSYDLVTPGKESLLARMPGDEWQKFANLRLFFACMAAQPGKKLIFMGDEFGQWNHWQPHTSLDWHLVQEGSLHAKLQRWVAELNRFYCSESALHQTDSDPESFEWINRSDSEWSTASWLRRNPASGEAVLAVFNFTPVPRHNYRVGVPGGGFWREVFNSDAVEYGGSGQGNLGGVEAAPFGWHFKSHSLTITLPPLGAVFFKRNH